MPPLYAFRGEGRILERAGVRHGAVVPYGVFRCADGSVNFAVQNQREWRRFCAQVLGCAELADDARWASNAQRLRNRAALETLIEDRFRHHSRAELLALLDAAGIANGAVNDIREVAEHPQLAARGRWTEV